MDMKPSGIVHTLLLGVITGILGLNGPDIQAQTVPPTQDSSAAEDIETMRAIHTLLIGGKVTTWLDLEYPPYDPISTLQSKMEQAGFQVVFDPQEPHDAILAVDYRETPSGTFRRLEQGTTVKFTTTLYHPKLGTIIVQEFEASPDEFSVEGLYWGTIRKLEEDPSYFYQGFILKEWLLNQANEGSVLAHRLRHVYIDGNFTKSDERPGRAFVRREARLNAIREMGRLNNPQAQETLWELTKMATPEERKVAVDVLGNIGDASFIPKLSQLTDTDQDPNVQLAIQAAIQAIQTRQ
jgi:HEAT repeats